MFYYSDTLNPVYIYVCVAIVVMPELEENQKDKTMSNTTWLSQPLRTCLPTVEESSHQQHLNQIQKN